MGLQTSDLVMVALGVNGDAPPLALQPPLVDGLHLRWPFVRARGFPGDGYYLFPDGRTSLGSEFPDRWLR